MLFLLHLGLEGITEVDTNPKRRFVSFQVTHSNARVLFVPLRDIAPENSWLGRRFFEGLQNHMQNLIVDNGVEDLWRRESPDCSEYTCYDRSFAKNPG